MNNIPGLKIGTTILPQEREAVEELKEKINQKDMHSVLFFCSSRYDLDILAQELKAHFSCQLTGCTTSGEISSRGYQEGGIVGVSFSLQNIKLQSYRIDSLSDFNLKDAKTMADSIRENLTLKNNFDRKKMFGLLLIDGLSIHEEQVISFIHSQMEGVSIAGGAAGDDLQLRETNIYSNGKFSSNAAAFIFIETTLPFVLYKTQHFKPTDKKVVITEADPPRRNVSEINAEPAAQEYARILGIPRSDIGPAVFSKYPLMIRIGDSWQVRSIQKVNEDESLTFYCAIDEGLVLTLSEGVDIISNLKEEIDRLNRSHLSSPLVIGFDCIHRKQEILERDLEKDFCNLIKDINLIGFNTYGEQYNSIHVNQTLTGVIIGSNDGQN